MIDLSLTDQKRNGAYLWNNENIYKGLNFDETILNSDFFNNFPFKKNIKKILLDSKTHHANKWTAYSFIKTFENLREINKKKN